MASTPILPLAFPAGAAARNAPHRAAFVFTKAHRPLSGGENPKSPRFKGLHALRRYANGEERCIACKLCEVVCPAACITIDSELRDDGTRRATVYDIDLFKCIFRGFCEEACPVDAIVLTRSSDFHFERRGENVIGKDQLLAIGDRMEEQITADRAADAPYR